MSAAVVLADTSSGDVAAIILAVLAVVVVVFVCASLVALSRTMRAMREAVEQLRRETLPMIASVQGTVVHANAELERVSVVLETAENISGTVDSASRLAYLALSNPIIKALAFGVGTARAARHFGRKA